MITLKIDVDIDDSEMKTLGRQVPFAMSKAMNSSMLKAQVRQRARMRAIYTVRSVRFLDLSTKITHFAKKNDLVSELAIDPPGDATNIYGKFELGGLKRPRDGRHIAVPATGTPIKRSRRSIIKKENKPRPLLDAAEVAPRDRGAFIRPAHGKYGPALFLRRGKHLILAYVFEDETEIAPTLKFEDVVAREFTRSFPADFKLQLAKAVATAR